MFTELKEEWEALVAKLSLQFINNNKRKWFYKKKRACLGQSEADL